MLEAIKEPKQLATCWEHFPQRQPCIRAPPLTSCEWLWPRVIAEMDLELPALATVPAMDGPSHRYRDLVPFSYMSLWGQHSWGLKWGRDRSNSGFKTCI